MLPAILLALQVAQASGTPPIVIPEIVNRARVDAAKVVDVHAMLVPDTVYVGQQSTYQLGVFMESVTRQRMRRNPEYVAPDVRDLLAYDVRDTPRGFVREVGNHPYEVHVFRRAIFALAPGTVEIPAARLSYALPQGGSYFSREESFTMRSEALRLTVIEPPAAGRPSEWRGAVGVYRVSATIGTTRAKAGAPLILTPRVEGQGNVTLLPRPPVELTWGTVISAGERVSVDSAPAALRGAKEFDWIVTPRSAGTQYVPALRFAYFNPFARRYEIAVSTPILKQVEVGDVVASVAPVVEAPSSPPLPILRAFAPERAPPLGQMWWYVVLLLCAPVPAAAVFWRTRPRTAKAPLTAWERAHALAGRDAGFDEGVDQAATVRRAFLDAIRERTGLDAAHLTTAGAWERALCLEGVTPGTARMTAEMLRDLDAASFHPRHLAPDDVHSRVGTLLRAIDREARGPRAGRARWVGRRFRPRRVPAAAICFFVAIAAGPVVAATIDRARADFTAGVASYDRGDFRRSAQHFADAAREAPRSREAWANFGTASWAASDSANAVVGWQRALRLARNHVEVGPRQGLTHRRHGAFDQRRGAMEAASARRKKRPVRLAVMRF